MKEKYTLERKKTIEIADSKHEKIYGIPKSILNDTLSLLDFVVCKPFCVSIYNMYREIFKIIISISHF